MSGKIVIAFNNFDKIAAALPRETGIVVRKTANAVKRYALQSMKGIKTGRVYGRHIASAPGEAPAVDTGNLKNSIFVENTSQTSAIVGVNAEYGVHLEYGTKRLAPRPFMRPAASRAEKNYILALTRLEKRLKSMEGGG